MLLEGFKKNVAAYIAVVVKNQRQCNRGQGVIEYAGALVIATVLVSFVLVIFPTPLTDFFFEIIETTLTLFIGFLP